MTTFHLMSNPDILLTVQAYTVLKMHKREKLRNIPSTPVDIATNRDQITTLTRDIERLEQLTETLIDEFDRREG